MQQMASYFTFVLSIEITMTFIITEPCVGTCDTVCVDVCPVDCIHGPISTNGMATEVPELRAAGKLHDKQLYIDPETCIDCGACVPECPVDAIYPDYLVPDDQQKFIGLNYRFFGQEPPT